MSDYQKEERAHYNSRFIGKSNRPGKLEKVFDQINEVSADFFYSEIFKYQKKLKTGKMLDYGCGTGSRSEFLADTNWKVYGIDISENSIEMGSCNFGSRPNLELSVMDCENTSFQDNTFDIIFDYGTFSSIDINIGIKEIARILKRGGVIVSIETLGHNPISNIKRKINMLLGKRTKWATNNIMTIEKWEEISKYFEYLL